MTMLRKESPGRYQIGIWAVTRVNSHRWEAVATGPGTIAHAPLAWSTLGAAYLNLTGEPLHPSSGKPAA
jgi:hypothetical protein